MKPLAPRLLRQVWGACQEGCGGNRAQHVHKWAHGVLLMDCLWVPAWPPTNQPSGEKLNKICSGVLGDLSESRTNACHTPKMNSMLLPIIGSGGQGTDAGVHWGTGVPIVGLGGDCQDCVPRPPHHTLRPSTIASGGVCQPLYRVSRAVHARGALKCKCSQH